MKDRCLSGYIRQVVKESFYVPKSILDVHGLFIQKLSYTCLLASFKMFQMIAFTLTKYIYHSVFSLKISLYYHL